MARLIDTGWNGWDRVIAAWQQDGVIIDPGPASTVEGVIGALGGEAPRAILLTHIHLDHAGGAGVLVRRFPNTRVFVHEVGAPHLADPSRLLASAARLYGSDRMEALWGEVLPVPADRITALVGGERVEGMDVLATPGHASHHVVYVDGSEGAAYVGDVAGVRIPPDPLTLMPTPPPEIDVEAWLGSIKAVAERRPRRLRLTHFGEVEDAEAQLGAAAESLRRAADVARSGDRESFLAAIEAEIGARPTNEGGRMRQVMPLEQAWLGLHRYWRKRES